MSCDGLCLFDKEKEEDKIQFKNTGCLWWEKLLLLIIVYFVYVYRNSWRDTNAPYHLSVSRVTHFVCIMSNQ